MSEAAAVEQDRARRGSGSRGRLRDAALIGPLVRVLERRETIGFLVSSNLRAGHRDKLLGNLWNLLDPLFFLGIYYVVFGIGLRQAAGNPGQFVVYLSAGVLTYHFLQGVSSQAATCIPANRAIIHETSFPKAVLPIALCVSRLYDFLWALLVLIAVLLLADFELSRHLAWLPLVIGLQTLLCMGVAFFIAYLGAFYADVPNIVAVGVRALFFASPIFYFARSEDGHVGIVPEAYIDYYMLNPLTCLMEAYRDVLLWGRAPDPGQLWYVAGVSTGLLIIGFALFSSGEGKFAKYL